MLPNDNSKISPARKALLEKFLRGKKSADAIPRRNNIADAPLSYSQQQIFLHAQLAGDAPIYNEPITIRRRGPLDISALERAFTEVVRRHEAWRTTFEWRGERVVQTVQPAPSQIRIPFLDLRDHQQPEAEAIRLATEDARQPFDLARGPMFRARLIQLADDDHRLFFTLHHIIFDGVSLYRILLSELITSYEAFAKNESPGLPDLPIQYSDYAIWQRNLIADFPPKDLAFWQQTLTDLPTLDLKTDRPRPVKQTYAGRAITFAVPPKTSTALKSLGQEQNATPFMTMVAAFMSLLYHDTRQTDLVIAGITAGRDRAETQNLLGCFLNTVPIRSAFSPEDSFLELLRRVRRATLDALSHDEVPFEFLAQKFARRNDSSRAPLAQVLIVVEPPLAPLPDNWSFTHMDVDPGIAKFDLQLGLDDRADGLVGRFIYNTDLFDHTTMENFTARWLQLLDEIVVRPSAPVAQLATRRMPKPEWSGVRTQYPRDLSIHRIFEEQATRRPASIALVQDNRRLTYDELNRRANRLARRLQKMGVKREQPVGVLMERSFEMIVALLAILKAGGAYVPLDSASPVQRLEMMIKDTRMPVILVSDQTRALPNESLTVTTNGFVEEADANFSEEVDAGDLAYVMYTSGSSGVPKGVAVPHRAVVRLVQETNYASFLPNESFLQLAPISFDASTFEIWGPLLNGGRLVLMPPAPPSLEEIGCEIREQGVTTLWLTSGLFNAMIDERLADLRPLRQLLAGGDVLSVAHVRKALSDLPATTLINGYGPTESTTFACCYEIENRDELHDSIPIGKPVANTAVYILDSHLQPVPIGESGELHIGGDGLACGYWNRPELTAEKFIADPFSGEPGARLYKTGDLACWRDNGTIEFLGRADEQIKLRGFRIEPGEIEDALKRQSGVRDAAVFARENSAGEKHLVAYVAGNSSPEILSASLQKALPEYMIPSAIVVLDALPRTENGKLDRRALPTVVPFVAEPREPLVRPWSELENQIAALWSDVLKVEHVGPHDNFFELGGHSLAGLRLVNRVRETLGANLAVASIFEAPTVEQMADLLRTKMPSLSARKPLGDLRPNESLSLPPVVAINRESRRALKKSAS